MFCNYCRAPNPDDCVYCSACGRAIRPSASVPKEEVNQRPDNAHSSSGSRTSNSPIGLKPDVRLGTQPTTAGPQANQGIPNGSPNANTLSPPTSAQFSNRNYGEMSDEQLAHIQAAYERVRVSPDAALVNEIGRRALNNKSTDVLTNSPPDLRNELSTRHSASPALTPNPGSHLTQLSEPIVPPLNAVPAPTGSEHNPVAPLPVYGSLGNRFTAYLADLIVIYLVVIAVYFSTTLLKLPLSTDEGISQLVTFVTIFVYMIIAQSLYHTTVGKYVHGLEVRSQRSEKDYPAFWRIAIRETVGRVLSSLFWGAGYWLAIKKPRRQAWSDELAGTVVTARPTNQVLKRAFTAFILVALIVDAGTISFGLYKEDKEKRYAALNKEIESASQSVDSARTAVTKRMNSGGELNSWSDFLRWQEQMKSLKGDLDQYENQIDLMQGLLQRGVSEHLASSNAEENQFLKLRQVYAIRKRQAEKLRQEADLVINCDGTKASLVSLRDDLQLLDSDIESLERQASQILAEIGVK